MKISIDDEVPPTLRECLLSCFTKLNTSSTAAKKTAPVPIEEVLLVPLPVSHSIVWSSLPMMSIILPPDCSIPLVASKALPEYLQAARKKFVLQTTRHLVLYGLRRAVTPKVHTLFGSLTWRDLKNYLGTFLLTEEGLKWNITVVDTEQDAAKVVLSLTSYVLRALEKPYSHFVPPKSKHREGRRKQQRGAGGEGLDDVDVFLSILCEIPKVSERRAMAVVERFPSLSKLLAAYEMIVGPTAEDERQGMLQNVVVSGDEGGRGERLGPVLSREIYRVLCKRS